jgi:hypothetical protein
MKIPGRELTTQDHLVPSAKMQKAKLNTGQLGRISELLRIWVPYIVKCFVKNGIRVGVLKPPYG